jgi:hypothetical protein
VKDLESKGFAFEGADGSFELLMRKALDGERAVFFRLIGFRVIDEKRHADEPPIAEATVLLEGPTDRSSTLQAQGNGPVNALDQALRKALSKFYPEVESIPGARLQGPRPEQHGGHGRARARAHRGGRRRATLDDGRRLPQRHRGVVASARR